MPKSTTLTAPPAVIEHILRLQIAVHDANVMRGAQRARDIGRDHDGARRVERTALDLAAQRCALRCIRGDEQASVNLPQSA